MSHRSVSWGNTRVEEYDVEIPMKRLPNPKRTSVPYERIHNEIARRKAQANAINRKYRPEYERLVSPERRNIVNMPIFRHFYRKATRNTSHIGDDARGATRNMLVRRRIRRFIA